MPLHWRLRWQLGGGARTAAEAAAAAAAAAAGSECARGVGVYQRLSLPNKVATSGQGHQSKRKQQR